MKHLGLQMSVGKRGVIKEGFIIINHWSLYFFVLFRSCLQAMIMAVHHPMGHQPLLQFKQELRTVLYMSLLKTRKVKTLLFDPVGFDLQFLQNTENFLFEKHFRDENSLFYFAGSFFREQFWNTVRFLIALFLITSLIEGQLQMKCQYKVSREQFKVWSFFFVICIIDAMIKIVMHIFSWVIGFGQCTLNIELKPELFICFDYVVQKHKSTSTCTLVNLCGCICCVIVIEWVCYLYPLKYLELLSHFIFLFF